jgi:hypothetical protein
MLKKIVSGGQTGSDRAGLIAAKNYGLETGGYIPKGFKTENGSEPQLGSEFGLMEFGISYPPRTLANIKYADATLIFYYTPLEKGSLLTKKYCEDLKKPYLLVCMDNYCRNTYGFMMQEIICFLDKNNVSILNVAGNRESKAPGIQNSVQELLEKVLSNYDKNRLHI